MAAPCFQSLDREVARLQPLLAVLTAQLAEPWGETWRLGRDARMGQVLRRLEALDPYSHTLRRRALQFCLCVSRRSNAGACTLAVLGPAIAPFLWRHPGGDAQCGTQSFLDMRWDLAALEDALRLLLFCTAHEDAEHI